jgi:hypothetical protein
MLQVSPMPDVQVDVVLPPSYPDLVYHLSLGEGNEPFYMNLTAGWYRLTLCELTLYLTGALSSLFADVYLDKPHPINDPTELTDSAVSLTGGVGFQSYNGEPMQFYTDIATFLGLSVDIKWDHNGPARLVIKYFNVLGATPGVDYTGVRTNTINFQKYLDAPVGSIDDFIPGYSDPETDIAQTIDRLRYNPAGIGGNVLYYRASSMAQMSEPITFFSLSPNCKKSEQIIPINQVDSPAMLFVPVIKDLRVSKDINLSGLSGIAYTLAPGSQIISSMKLEFFEPILNIKPL